jgi:hypothetical protein
MKFNEPSTTPRRLGTLVAPFGPTECAANEKKHHGDLIIPSVTSGRCHQFVQAIDTVTLRNETALLVERVREI